MKIYVCNAFSLSMLDRSLQASDRRCDLRIPRPIDDPRGFIESWKPHAELVSAVGHADTARLFSDILGVPIVPARITVKLDDLSTMALVGQYIGPRLPEGATELPEGARIEWWVV